MQMFQLTSTRFGELEVDESDIITFPVGVPGFEERHNWILMGDEDNAIMWMQCADDGTLALPVTTPDAVRSDYNAQIPREALEPIGEVSEDDVAILLVVTIPPGKPWEMTANLKAPIVVNRAARLAMQAIALNEEYGFRYPVLDEGARERIQKQAPAAEKAR